MAVEAEAAGSISAPKSEATLLRAIGLRIA
jgi:hypothetical protein